LIIKQNKRIKKKLIRIKKNQKSKKELIIDRKKLEKTQKSEKRY